MKGPTILILTKSPSYWSSFYSKLNEYKNVIIHNTKINPNKLKYLKEVDLLIVHTTPDGEYFSTLYNLSKSVCIKSTFILPPGYSEPVLIDSIAFLKEKLLAERSADLALMTASSIPANSSAKGALYLDKKHENHLSGFMLGSFSVLVNGLGIEEWRGRKAKSILAYLLYNRRFANSREIIMDKFWPNVSPKDARNSLNGIIHKIRGMLKCLDPNHDYILFKEEKYLLNPDLSINLDYESFLSCFRTGQQIERQHGLEKAIQYYEEATRFYKGDFLEENIYDEWTYSERESFKQKYLHAMDRLSAFYVLNEKFLLAQQYCRKMLDKDDCLEAIHRRLMTCFYKNGYRDLAVKQFYKCADSLQNGLDITPSQETIDLLDGIIRDAA